MTTPMDDAELTDDGQRPSLQGPRIEIFDDARQILVDSSSSPSATQLQVSDDGNAGSYLHVPGSLRGLQLQHFTVRVVCVVSGDVQCCRCKFGDLVILEVQGRSQKIFGG